MITIQDESLFKFTNRNSLSIYELDELKEFPQNTIFVPVLYLNEGFYYLQNSSASLLFYEPDINYVGKLDDVSSILLELMALRVRVKDAYKLKQDLYNYIVFYLSVLHLTDKDETVEMTISSPLILGLDIIIRNYFMKIFNNRKIYNLDEFKKDKEDFKDFITENTFVLFIKADELGLINTTDVLFKY